MHKKPILGAFWPMCGQLLTINSSYSRGVGSKAMNESEYCAGDLKMGGKLASHIWLMLKAFWCSKALAIKSKPSRAAFRGEPLIE
jgi:hypothetical protein